MRAALPLFDEAEARHITLAAHTQAVEHAIQTMNTHLREALTLEDLAATAYLSPSHFNRVFRRQIGVPPGEYLAALRLQAARHLLLATSLSVTDICFEVGYASHGSFTTRFTQLAGVSPRLLRQRAHAFELSPREHVADVSTPPDPLQVKNALLGWISAPAQFRGAIYVGLFTRPLPQGRPVRCAKLYSSGFYRLTSVPDGVYYLLAAAFPMATDRQSYLVPGKNMLVGKSARPLIIHNGQLSGDPDLTLRSPRLTDPPLVMALPLL